MLGLRTDPAVDIAVPVEVAVVIIFSCGLIHYCPWARRVFRKVIASVIKHLQAAVCLSILENVMSGVRRVVHEVVDYVHMLISRADEVR